MVSPMATGAKNMFFYSKRRDEFFRHKTSSLRTAMPCGKHPNKCVIGCAVAPTKTTSTAVVSDDKLIELPQKVRFRARPITTHVNIRVKCTSSRGLGVIFLPSLGFNKFDNPHRLTCDQIICIPYPRASKCPELANFKSNF